MSLSKIGLPGVRTGIVVAREEIARAIAAINARINLSTASFGPALVRPLFQSDEILELSRNVIRPYYERKVARTIAQIEAQAGDLPVRIHLAEGAIFLWLWFQDLPISCMELYQRLKSRGVLVIPGDSFFPGLDEEISESWPHRHQCLRVSYAQDDAMVERGIAAILDEAKRAYA